MKHALIAEHKVPSGMFWKLQENVVSYAELDMLVSFIRQTNRFTQFTKVKEFETIFAAWQGCKYCVFVNSGSSANLVMVAALKELYKWHAGDEVIVPAVTWPTTVTPVMQLGLKPVFVDVNLKDLSLDYDKVESRISPKTRGIFVTHLLGFPADVQKIKEIVKGRSIVIFEDACESQGASSNGIKVGNLGIAGTFSFYWGHHMTTVEGGMLCTNNEDLYKLFLLKRSHGLARELPARYHKDLQTQYSDIDFNFLFLTDGFNFRNTEFSAVLGISQIGRLEEFINIRNANYKRFLSICKLYPEDLLTLEKEGMASFALPFIFKNESRKKICQASIRSAGIESRPLISGNLLRQPFLLQCDDPRKFPNAEILHLNSFYIGNNQFVNESRLDILAKVLEDSLRR